MINKKYLWPLCLGFLGTLAYSLFSYALTDPNLTLISNPNFTRFQYWMWREFGGQPFKLVTAFGLTTGMIWIGYFWFMQVARSQILTWRTLVITALFWSTPLFFSYNALSHDVFNYMFNAKMVMVYQANPHVQVALDFPHDPWIRFMHNVHTPAPYWYGWTALSIIPFLAGGGKFLLTWLGFRVWSVLPLALLVGWYWHLSKQKLWQLEVKAIAWLLLNPLVIIEVISNSHNDFWMMLPAVVAVTTLHTSPMSWFLGLQVGFLWLLSISTKLASVVLAPIIAWLSLNARRPHAHKSRFSLIAVVAILLFTIPLLLPRSQQFHPWYAIWLVVWLPFVRERERLWVIPVVVFLTITSMYRYIPWLWSGYTSAVYDQQRMITWSAIPLALLWTGIVYTWKKR